MISSQLHNLTLGEKIESAHDCQTYKTARSLQILQKIGQIPSHKRVQGKNFRSGLSCKNVLIGLTLTRDVSREK